MMRVYTYSEARQKLSLLLDRVSREGEVRIIKKDGKEYKVIPMVADDSPFNVKSIRTNVSTRDIVAAVRDSRKR